MLGSREDAEDALQSGLLKAYRAYEALEAKEESGVAAWIHRVVYRSCLDLQRARRRHVQASPMEEVALASSGEATSDVRFQAKATLRLLMEPLSPEARVVVLLVFGCGFDYSTVAKVLGVRVGTVASRVSRARQIMAKVLAEMEGESNGTAKP